MTDQTIIRVKSMVIRDTNQPDSGVVVTTDQGDVVTLPGLSAHRLLYWYAETPGIEFVVIHIQDGDWEYYTSGWRWPDGYLHVGTPKCMTPDVGLLPVYGMGVIKDWQGRRRWLIWTNDHLVYYTCARGAERVYEMWVAGRTNDCMLDVSQLGRKLVLRWVPAQV